MTVIAPPRLCLICEQPSMKGIPGDVYVCRDCDLPRHNTVHELPEGTMYCDPETGEVQPLTPELFIEGSSWRFAASMPEIPHEYTVRDLMSVDANRSSCLSHDTFEWFVRHIREHGVKRKFRRSRKALSYLVVGDWEYWTMGYAPEVTTIINRQQAADLCEECNRKLGPEDLKTLHMACHIARGRRAQK